MFQDNTSSPFIPWIVLFFSIFSVCLAAPLAKSISSISPLGIGFWRTAIVGCMMLIWTWKIETRLGVKSFFESIPQRQLYLSVIAGVLLGWHFWSWFASLQYTSALRSTTLVCLNPIWVGLLQVFGMNSKPHLSFWIGTMISIFGVVLMSEMVDISQGSIFGDGLAVLGGILGALYLSIGQHVRQDMSIQRYGSIICLSAAGSLLLACFITRETLIPTDINDIYIVLLMALGPQFCGHIGMNYALGYISATLVSVLLLLEPVGVGILAIPILGEIPTNREILGTVVILLGLMIVFYPKIMPKKNV